METFASILWTTATYLLGFLTAVLFTVTYVLSQLHLRAIKIICAQLGKSFDPVEGPDVAFQYNDKSYFGDPSCAAMANVVLILNGKLELNAFRQRVCDHIITIRRKGTGVKEFPRWTQRIVKRHGFLVWEEVKDFSIERHVMECDVGYTDDASLLKVLVALRNKPLPGDRPPWDIMMVPKLREDEEGAKVDTYAVIFRFCHSLMDGMRFLQAFSFLADKGLQRSFNDLQEALHLMPFQLPPVVKQHALLRYWASPEQPLKLTSLKELILNVVLTLLYIPHQAGFSILFREKNGLTGPNHSGRKLMAISEPLELSWMRDVSKAFGCTASDVYYSCVVASFRQCDPDLSAHMRMYIAQSVLKPCTSRSENTFSFCSAILPTIHSDPVKQLKCISHKIQIAKKSPEVICNWLVCRMFKQWFFPNNVYYNMLRSTIMATNLNGPPFEIFIGGDTMAEMIAIPPNLGRCGIVFSLFSYNGSVRVLVTVDRAVAPNEEIAQKLITKFTEELKQLHSSIDDNH